MSDHGTLASVAHLVAGRGPYVWDAAHQSRSDNGYHHDMSRRDKEGTCRHPDGTHARHPRSAGGGRSWGRARDDRHLVDPRPGATNAQPTTPPGCVRHLPPPAPGRRSTRGRRSTITSWMR